MAAVEGSASKCVLLNTEFNMLIQISLFLQNFLNLSELGMSLFVTNSRQNCTGISASKYVNISGVSRCALYIVTLRYATACRSVNASV